MKKRNDMHVKMGKAGGIKTRKTQTAPRSIYECECVCVYVCATGENVEEHKSVHTRDKKGTKGITTRKHNDKDTNT